MDGSERERLDRRRPANDAHEVASRCWPWRPARAGADTLRSRSAPAEARAGLVAMISPWIAPWAVAVVVAAMLGLVAACLACALTPRGTRCD